jgi:hypothetical protein
MTILNYNTFVNEEANEEFPKTLQGFALSLDYFHIGAYYTLPDFLDAVFESEIGMLYDEEDGRLLTVDDLMERIQSYHDSTHWANLIPRLWCGLKLKDMSNVRYTSLSDNPYSAVDTLDRWFTNSRKEMSLHYNGNWEKDLSWLARSMENDKEIVVPYAEAHPEMTRKAVDLMKSGDQDEINALISYNKIKGYI